MIDQTISDIRVHFPDNEIIMQIDGLREEQKDRKKDYDEYKNRISLSTKILEAHPGEILENFAEVMETAAERLKQAQGKTPES
jgi:hypothetical protein